MGEKVIALNRKAFHDYHILERWEAGLVLTGTEIKSIRLGRVNLSEAYAYADKGELWLGGAHIARYEAGGPYNHDPTRPRKLLLHHGQIAEIVGQLSAKRLTMVPLKLYLKDGRAKVEIGLARGKRQYDKREAIKERDVERELRRVVKERK